MCETKILSRKGSAMICRCADCRNIYIWHQNLILNFTENQFSRFKTFSAGMDFDERSLPFPDGQERAVLRTPHQDISFTFTQPEWTDFKAAMDEATYLLEVYSLIGE